MIPSASLLIRVAVCVAICGASFDSRAETISWSFSIDEQSVRNGPESDGSTNSPGQGQGTVELDLVTNVISMDFSWSGMIGELTKLHIHGPATIDNSNPQHLIEIFGPPEVPLELVATSGSWSDSFELQTLVQPGFDTIEPSLIVDALVNGQAYLNVHTTVFGTGEIRGNLGLPVPEPGSHWMLLIGLSSLAALRRRKSHVASSLDEPQ